MSDGNRDCAEQSFVHSYDDWWDQLDGKPSALPASRVGLGFYAKRERNGSHVGIAIWAADGHPVAKYGHAPAQVLNKAALEEDFSFNVLSWCVAVPEEAYVAWAAKGEWPEGTKLDRPKRQREKPARVVEAPAAAAQDVPVAPTEVVAKVSAVFVRLYQVIDPPSPAMAFMAMVIQRAPGGGEGFAVRFYGQDRRAAEDRAQAWVEAERQKSDAQNARNAALGQRAAARQRKPQSEQPETEGAPA